MSFLCHKKQTCNKVHPSGLATPYPSAARVTLAHTVMKYEELIKNWESKELYRFDLSYISGKGLNEETADFLSVVGLPTSAAPFLSFAGEAEKELCSISDLYETGEAGHKYFLSIGADGAGNPICIDIKHDCQIVALNHEQDYIPSFVNSSVKELFQSLTIYKAFGEELIKTNGEDAFLDANFTDRQYEELKKGLEAVDSKALRENSFWAQELELLLGNREYYKSQK